MTAYTYPDVERAAVDHLAADFGEGVPVVIGLPSGWDRDSDPVVSVNLDGTPRDRHPAAQFPTIRVTVWARKATDAKRIAQEAHGLLLERRQYQPLTGLLPAHDPDHDAELASFTVRATTRAVPIP